MRILPVVAAVTAAFLVVACSSPIINKYKKWDGTHRPIYETDTGSK